MEASPRFQENKARLEASYAYVTAAREVARLPASDQKARDELAGRIDIRDRLDDDATAVWGAVEIMGRSRNSFIDDRAYRLFTAAMTGSAVRPIDPAVADAFEQLAALEPRLRELGDGDKERQLELVGFGVRGSDPLLRSDVAANVLRLYGKAKRGDPVDLERPWFETQGHGGVITGGIGRRRPQARN